MGKAWDHDQVKMGRDTQLIAEALEDWRLIFTEDLTQPTDFTPTTVLYDSYLRWMPRHAPNVKPLCAAYFGRLLGKALGVESSLKVKRTYKGVIVHGYLCLRGPGSIVVTNKRGRQYVSVKAPHEAAAPAPEVPGGATASPDAGA